MKFNTKNNQKRSNTRKWNQTGEYSFMSLCNLPLIFRDIRFMHSVNLLHFQEEKEKEEKTLSLDCKRKNKERTQLLYMHCNCI